MDQKERLEELIYQNKLLTLQVQSLEKKLEQYRDKLHILVRQTDEWAKSYNNLLEDFIAYRNDRRKD